MPTITFTNNGWSPVQSGTDSSTGLTVYYTFSTPYLDFSNDINQNIDCKVLLTQITIKEINGDRGGNWKLGLVYDDYGSDWDGVFHMDFLAFSEYGHNGPGMVLFDGNTNSAPLTIGPNYDVNDRNTIPPSKADKVKFILYTYTQPSNLGSWGIDSFETEISYMIAHHVNLEITKITGGEYKLTIEVNFNQNYFNVEEPWLVKYCYSKNENFLIQDAQVTNQYYIQEEEHWCECGPEDDINNIEITSLEKNTTYYIWIAAELKHGYYTDYQRKIDAGQLSYNDYGCSDRYSGITLNDSRCSKPTITSVTSDGITITVEWTGGSNGNYHSKTGYEIGYNTNPTTGIANIQSVSSDTYTYTYTNSFNNNTTYYFFVRTITQNSDYNSFWSDYEEFLFIVKPKVSIGSKIKANQITNLINYLSSTPKPKIVTKGNVILIGDTNNYNSNKATQYEKINADWYNN